MADLERTYNIPLRKGVMKAPIHKRANKAIRTVREFLQKHMKTQNVKLGPNLNAKILEHGRKNVPHHIEVKVIKNKDNTVKAELSTAKDLSFIKPKIQEEKIKIRIPGLGKKEEQKAAIEIKPEAIEKTEEKKEQLEKEQIKIETSRLETDQLEKEITKKHRGKLSKDREAVKSPRKSLEAETYGRPNKKIQHKKPKKE